MPAKLRGTASNGSRGVVLNIHSGQVFLVLHDVFNLKCDTCTDVKFRVTIIYFVVPMISNLCWTVPVCSAEGERERGGGGGGGGGQSEHTCQINGSMKG